MKTDFLCPKCQGYLSVDNKIFFAIKGKRNRAGILLMSPTLGDYSYTTHPSFIIEPGEELDFFCPICHENLSVQGTDKLAKVVMREEDRYEYYIVFSKKEGERCTYRLSEKKIETFGDVANKYLDFLSASGNK
jgi:uncharacterized protein YbaR (Trm112 family)